MPLKIRRQKGAMLITISFWFITLIGFAALAFDIGHLMIVRNELQNGADAAALAGANCLDKTTAGSGTDCTNAKSSTLNWATASTKATNSIGLNKSDSTVLVNGTVQTGYWDVNGGTALQPTTLSPLGPCTIAGGVMTTACDKPAVMVTISRASGNNGGAVGTLIASMFGGAAIPIAASAVAIISSPGNVLPGTLIPQAINKCMFDKYWDSTTNSPTLADAPTLTYLDGNDNKSYNIPQIIGQPWRFRIGSSLHYGTCDSGQWTTFNEGFGNNGNQNIVNLINNGNTNPLGIGDLTHLNPGTRQPDYDALDKKYPTGPGADVTIVVVDADPLSSNIDTPVVAFAGFHIDDVKGANGPNPKFYIEGHFIANLTTPGSSGIGPFYGTYTPPRLAQ